MTSPAPRVTVLDDDPQALELMRDVLDAEGYRVSCTTRVGPELHEVRETQPDLVILDLLLASDQRELSGWDIARLVRSHADLHRVPILVISADHQLLRKVAAEARFMRDVRLLAKPFSLDELLSAVREALGGAVGAAVLRETGQPEGSSTASAYD